MSTMADTYSPTVAVLGLGYVGLPLALALAEHFMTLGFDTDHARIDDLALSHDRNAQVSKSVLAATSLRFSGDAKDLSKVDFFIVTVPTPVTEALQPDHGPLLQACRLIGDALAARPARLPDDSMPIVVFESTVYPGCTEEVCIPMLESVSGLRFREGFAVGYSPERIDPGDRDHTIDKVIKIISACDEVTLAAVETVYGRVALAGLHKAPNIRTAEAAKVVENVQRDLNIALMNELAILFHRLDIETKAVLDATGTKWNALPFKPGLVGGHCIPVDPYYLTYRAAQVGFHPEMILAGRRVNESMGAYVAHETVRLLTRAQRPVRGADVLVLGATFKENVPDLRNTKISDLSQELCSFGCNVSVFDPLVDDEALLRIGVTPGKDPFTAASKSVSYDAVVVAVAHADFQTPVSLERIVSLVQSDHTPGVLVDVKGVLGSPYKDTPGVISWSL